MYAKDDQRIPIALEMRIGEQQTVFCLQYFLFLDRGGLLFV
jgi:hypothetical protein